MRSGRGSNLIRRLMRWARITRPGDDVGDFPIQQVGYLGKIGDALVWFPYGMHANIPADELVLALSMQGNPEARVVLPGSPKKRIKVAASEVVFFHPETGSRLHFKANGDIEIFTAGNTLVDSLIHTIKGDFDHDGTNFGIHGVAPAPLSPAYTPTNVTPDRSFDADSLGAGELADVVGTLIADLQLKGIIG